MLVVDDFDTDVEIMRIPGKRYGGRMVKRVPRRAGCAVAVVVYCVAATAAVSIGLGLGGLVVVGKEGSLSFDRCAGPVIKSAVQSDGGRWGGEVHAVLAIRDIRAAVDQVGLRQITWGPAVQSTAFVKTVRDSR